MADGRNMPGHSVPALVRPTGLNQRIISEKPVPLQGKQLNFVSTILYSQLCHKRCLKGGVVAKPGMATGSSGLCV